MAAERLRAARDVRAVFAARRANASAVAVVHTMRRDRDTARFTVVAGKRVGNAVARNRAKRRLRAALRELPLQPGTDYVVVARPGAVTAPWSSLAGALSRQVAAGSAR